MSSPTAICVEILRLTGADREAMGSAHENFVRYKEDGKLLAPDIVGGAIARIALCRDDKVRSFSGRFINWNDDAIINTDRKVNSLDKGI